MESDEPRPVVSASLFARERIGMVIDSGLYFSVCMLLGPFLAAAIPCVGRLRFDANSLKRYCGYTAPDVNIGFESEQGPNDA